MISRLRFIPALAIAVLVVVATAAPVVADPGRHAKQITNIVVIFEENHSFDNLFGGWERVDGVRNVSQVAADGTPLPCLPQTDVNLASPPLPVTCSGTTRGGIAISSNFVNRPFQIDQYIAPEDTTCPPPTLFSANGVLKGSGLPGGCTRDLVHRFYNEQYQINGGRQNRYVTGSDAAGLAMGYYDTRALPIYQYLHSTDAPKYAIYDRFFQGAFGGSFLNHQWLIAAAAPAWPGATRDYGSDDQHSIVGPDGFPAGTPLHPASPGTKDTALTQAANPDGSCTVKPGVPAPPAGTVCGDYAINTIQPAYQPYAPGTAASRRLPPQSASTIGDRLSAADVNWAWYSGGWSNANGDVGQPGWTNGTTLGVCTDPHHNASAVYPNCPDQLFQYHHQPFNYYANYAPGTAARADHLRDEQEFIAAAEKGDLKPVSFVKPVGAENEHPGYASEHQGSDHLVELLTAIENGPDADNTLVIVTYDEFGGQFDHVRPPTKPGISDQWGPGTRIPALVVSPLLKHDFAVDSTSHDTTSILTTIEAVFGVPSLTSRDASVADLLVPKLFSPQIVGPGPGS